MREKEALQPTKRILWLLPWHRPFSLWRRNGKAFCERPFSLRRQQPETEKQNVNVIPPTGKIYVDARFTI